MDIFTRTRLLIGENGLEKLKNSKVMIFGVGGVGSFCIEAIARAGIGHIHVVDDDTVSITNINRQLIATTKTILQGLELDIYMLLMTTLYLSQILIDN